MKYRSTLSRRIAIAFITFSAVIGGSFVIGTFFTIHFVESRLVSKDLSDKLGFLVANPDYRKHINLGGDLELFIQPDNGPQIVPNWVLSIKPGFQEVFHKGLSYHSWTQDIEGKRHFLLSNQSVFERHERILFGIILTGFIISLLTAWLLSRVLIKRTIAPVVRLSAQVRDLAQLVETPRNLAEDYPNDEVGQLAASFDHLTDQFRQVLAREKLFSADVSHELRTPLMVISSSCELMREDSSLQDKHSIKIRSIADAAEEMSQLVSTLLMLLRSEHGGLEGQAQANLVEIIHHAESKWRPLIEKQQLIFEVFTPLPESDVRVLPKVFVEIVVNNLLRNALQHTTRGSITLKVSNDRLVVQDTGMGIPSTIQHQLYEPFIQGDASRREATGLGLGLSLVSRICQNQGWDIQVKTSRDSGSEFTVRFCPAMNNEQ